MKGILFKEEMFNAVVEGLKTQTRRVIHRNELPPEKTELYDELKDYLCNARSKYKKGEIIYLKEPYVLIKKYPCAVEENSKILKAEYKYDKQTHVQKIIPWKNKLFMPEKYARYFIRILNVRVERLHNISEEDARDEGVEMQSSSWIKNPPVKFSSYRSGFFNKWIELYGFENFTSNPWIWVIEFERVIL